MLAELDSLIPEAMAEWKLPGLAIAVVHNDEPILVKAFGRRDIDFASPHVIVDDACRRTAFYPIRATPAAGTNAAISDMCNLNTRSQALKERS